MITLPFDIICVIIDFTATDRGTLSQIALGSRDCSAYANRYIWREFSLTKRRRVMTPITLEERCNSVMRDTQRASCVRQLTIALRQNFEADMSIMTTRHPDATGGLIAENTKHGVKRLFDLVAAAVAACAPRLESLLIFGSCHLSDVGHALSRLVERPAIYRDTLSPHPPHPASPGSHDGTNTEMLLFPSLTTFDAALSHAHGIMPFLVYGCPKVGKWEINGLGAQKCMENIPRNLFPALEEFQGMSTGLKDVTRGRRVRRIVTNNSLNATDDVAVRHLLDGLEASAAPVSELGITLFLGPVVAQNFADVQLMRSIARAAPSLKFLELFSHGEYTEQEYGPDVRHRFAESLAVFRRLEEFKWWDRRGEQWNDTFAKECFEGSRALQRVIVNKQQHVRGTP